MRLGGMRIMGGLLAGMFLWIALAVKGQVPVDSTLVTKPLQPVLDSLAKTSETQAQNADHPGNILAAIGILIGAGLIVFLLYNVRSR